MNIVGMGNEIVEVARVYRMINDYGEQFLTRVYTDREVRFCQSRRRATEQFAALWAGKEATLRALRMARRFGVTWRDIELRRQPLGDYKIAVRGRAKELAQNLKIGDVIVSLAHCRTHAYAHVIAIGITENKSES